MLSRWLSQRSARSASRKRNGCQEDVKWTVSHLVRSRKVPCSQKNDPTFKLKAIGSTRCLFSSLCPVQNTIGQYRQIQTSRRSMLFGGHACKPWKNSHHGHAISVISEISEIHHLLFHLLSWRRHQVLPTK
jgi:hypothetical protein